MDILDSIHRLLSRLSLWAVWAGGLAMLFSALIVFAEVIGRKIGGNEILPGLVLPEFRVPGSDEYTGYIFAGATTWAYAYCLIHRSHIRIDALYNLFPQKVRAILDVIGLALLAFCAVLLVICNRVYRSFRNMIALNWEREAIAQELGDLTGSLRDRNRQLRDARRQLTDLVAEIPDGHFLNSGA